MAGQSAVELKGGMYTLLSLQIHSVDIDAVSEALKNKVQQAPGFFKDTPIVLDLSPVEHMDDLDTRHLLKVVSEHSLIAIAARVSNRESHAALRIALPVLDTGPARINPLKNAERQKTIKLDNEFESETDVESEDEGEIELESENENDGELDHCLVPPPMLEMPASGPTIITRPVRSGQQIYAQGGELVVLAQAGAGAELIADSNIHVYGPLRGRALCGVTGNTNARIFCRSLEAELVSVAGNFKPLEEIPADLKGRPAQIWWDGEKLRIEAMQ